MTQTTVKCALCDVQMSPWCQGRCIHAKAIVPPPKAEKTPKEKRIQQGGKDPEPVYCVTTDTWYVSAMEAALSVNSYESNINNACRKGTKCSNLHWMKGNDPNLPPEAARKRKYKKRPVRKIKNLKTGEIYEGGVTEAAKALKISKWSAYEYLKPSFKRTKIIEYITGADNAV